MRKSFLGRSVKTDPRKRQTEVAVALHVSSCRIGEEKILARN